MLSLRYLQNREDIMAQGTLDEQNTEDMLGDLNIQNITNINKWLDECSVPALEEFIGASAENTDLVREQIFPLNDEFLDELLEACEKKQTPSLHTLLQEKKDESISGQANLDDETIIDDFDLPVKQGISRKERDGSTKSNHSSKSDDSGCVSDYSEPSFLPGGKDVLDLVGENVSGFDLVDGDGIIA